MTDWSNLQEDYERLGSFRAVAQAYRVAPETVSRKAKELGVLSRRRWRAQHLDPAEIRRLYDDGATVPELAERFSSSESTIYLRLWMAGAQMRAPGPSGYKWGPEQYEKRALATTRGAFQGAQRERFRRLGRETPKANSPQEQLFHKALMKARISFETQCRMLSRYYPDITLLQKPVLIEIDSWGHQLPDSAAFDARRDAAFRAAGYETVRFMNEQVDADADGCLRQVIERFSLEPEGNPAALIRSRRGAEPVLMIPVYSDDDIV